MSNNGDLNEYHTFYKAQKKIEENSEKFDPVKWWSERKNKSPILCKKA